MGLATASDLYPYEPVGDVSVVFNVLYSLCVGPHCFLSCYRCRWRPVKHRYTVCLLVAAVLSTAGYGVRTASVNNPNNVSLYTTSSTLIVVSPTFVCATLYLLLVHMIQAYLPARRRMFFHVEPRLLGALLISSDVISCIMQGAGSGIAGSGSWKGRSRTAGVGLLLVGLALQLATFTFFLVLTWRFVCRLRTAEGGHSDRGLHKMLTGVWMAGSCVELRTFYRLVEFALGSGGYPLRHEWTLYVLEATPMLVAIGTLAFYHPVDLVQKS